MPPQLQLQQQRPLPPPRAAPRTRRCRARAPRTHATAAAAHGQQNDAPPPASRGRVVVVVGGGIAGLAATLALRNRGFEATCYEAARSGAALDQLTGIVLRSDAMAALRRIDPAVADAVTAQGDVLSRVLLRAPDGTLLAQRALHDEGGGSSSTDGSSTESDDEADDASANEETVCVRWGVLWRALAGALPPDALRFDHALHGYEEAAAAAASARSDSGSDVGAQQGQVLAVFGCGNDCRSAVRADALVGADGLRSRVRAQLRGVSEAPPVDAGATVFRGVIDSAHASARGLCPAGAAVHAAAPDGRTLSIASLGAAQPLGLHDGTLFWVLSLPDGHKKATSEAAPSVVPFAGDYTASAHAEGRLMAALAASPATTLAAAAAAPTASQRIADAFVPDFADVAALLAATPPGAITERRLFHRAREAPPASYDNDGGAESAACCVTLLGDAAHMALPSLGVGACLSLRAADALAAELDAAAHASDGSSDGSLMEAGALAAALRRFERRQRRAAACAVAGAAAHARRVVAAGGASASTDEHGDVLPTSGAAFAGWLLGNAHRGGRHAAAAAAAADADAAKHA